jgi:hypothetical protein
VSTAVAAVRDPRGTASQAVGLVKLTAGAGLGLVRGHLGDTSADAPAEEKRAEETPVVKPTVEKPAAEQSPAEEPAPEEVEPEEVEPETTEPEKAQADDPRDHIPGPDLAAFAPPAPEDLPEPIVIEAE